MKIKITLIFISFIVGILITIVSIWGTIDIIKDYITQNKFRYSALLFIGLLFYAGVLLSWLSFKYIYPNSKLINKLWLPGIVILSIALIELIADFFLVGSYNISIIFNISLMIIGLEAIFISIFLKYKSKKE